MDGWTVDFERRRARRALQLARKSVRTEPIRAADFRNGSARVSSRDEILLLFKRRFFERNAQVRRHNRGTRAQFHCAFPEFRADFLPFLGELIGRYRLYFE